MKKNEKPLSKKKSNPNIGFMSNVLRSTKGLFSKYFPKKQKPQSPKEEIDEHNWWEWGQ